MAAGLMKARIPAELHDKVQVQSAGTFELVGEPASALSVQVSRELGADISAHRSQGLSLALVQEADLILVMSPHHLHYLHTYYRGVNENMFLLRSFARGGQGPEEDSVEDPLGHGLEVYRECGDLIAAEIDRIQPAVVELIRQKLAAMAE